MKKIAFWFLAVLAITTWQGCDGLFNSDDETLVMNISGGEADEYEVGTSITFFITLRQTGGELATFQVTPSLSGASGTKIVGTTPANILSAGGTFEEDNEEAIVEYLYVAPSVSTETEVTIIFKATNDNSGSTTDEVTFKIKPKSSPVKQQSITLGNWYSATGSFYVSSSGQAYTANLAGGNPRAVDLVYWHGASNGPFLAAPNDDLINQTDAGSVLTAQNATKIKVASISSSDFDAIATDSDLTNKLSGVSFGYDSHATNLSSGNVLVFLTSSNSTNPNKMGFIKINSITGTSYSAGTISFQVKIQN